MPEITENQTIVDVAQDAVDPFEVVEGLYIARGSDGGATVVDVRDHLATDKPCPARKTGSKSVTDLDAFAGYLHKHGTEATELWGSRDRANIRAVINAHQDAHGAAGWEDHTVTYLLMHSDDWKDWITHDGKLWNQLDFAEFIEDHLPNFVTPSAADMLELAQTFQATTKVDFASSQRVQSGETQLTYAEQQDAKAGKKGQLAIPDTFAIGVQVYDRGEAFKVEARFRYRINGGNLLLGYRLNRPKDVLQAAYDGVVAKVTEETDRTVWATP